MSKQFSFKQFNLTYKTVPCQTIQFSISKGFKCQNIASQSIQFSLNTEFSSFWPIGQVLLLRDRVNLGVMTINEYSAFPKAPSLLESHHQIIRGGILPLFRDAVGVFYSCSQQSNLTHLRNLNNLMVRLQ